MRFLLLAAMVQNERGGIDLGNVRHLNAKSSGMTALPSLGYALVNSSWRLQPSNC
jgi:hypothetical protein